MEFSVNAYKPVMVPVKSDKFRENKHISEPIGGGGVSLKSLDTAESGYNNSGFENNETPPSYLDVQQETRIA